MKSAKMQSRELGDIVQMKSNIGSMNSFSVKWISPDDQPRHQPRTQRQAKQPQPSQQHAPPQAAGYPLNREKQSQKRCGDSNGKIKERAEAKAQNGSQIIRGKCARRFC